MDEAIKEFKVGDETLKIYYHTDSESPREWDNLSQMIFTGRYSHLGDKHDVEFNGVYEDRFDFMLKGAEELMKQIKDVVICKPVHLYNHTGISISTHFGYPYNCRWDSGTIGFVIVTKQAIRENWGIKRVTQKYLDKVESILDGEISTLNQWIEGEIFGFVHENEDGDNEDSCWGFFGDNFETNGMLDYVDEKFHQAIKDD